MRMWRSFVAIAIVVFVSCVEPSQSTPRDPASIMESKNCGKPVRTTRLSSKVAEGGGAAQPPPSEASNDDDCPQ